MHQEKWPAFSEFMQKNCPNWRSGILNIRARPENAIGAHRILKHKKTKTVQQRFESVDEAGWDVSNIPNKPIKHEHIHQEKNIYIEIVLSILID